MSLAGKKILITGASGFIGSRLVGVLVGITQVIASTRSPVRSCGTGNLDVQHVQLDVTDEEMVQAVMSRTRPDVVVHLAAVVNASRSLDVVAEQVRITAGGTVNLAVSAVRSGRPLFIQLGSSEEYGDGPVPFTEDQPPRAISPYSAAKIAATQFLTAAFRSLDLPVIILRPTVVYGPEQKKMLIAYLFNNYLKGSVPELTAAKQTRDFVYVDDVVGAIVSCCGRGDLAGQIFNISSATEHTVKDVATMVAELCEYKGDLGLGRRPYRQPEIMRHLASYDRASQELAWQPTVGLQEGLERTCAWWQQHREQAKPLF